MKKILKALKSLIVLGWILSLVFLCLPVQLGQAVSGPGAAVNSAATYDFNLLEPFQSGFLINRELSLPITIENTGSSVDQYSVTCTKESGGDDWSASLVNNLGQILANTCLVGSYFTPPVSAGGSLTVYIHLQAPLPAPIGDYLRINLTVTSRNDSNQSASVLRQGAVSAPFIQNFSDSVIGRRLQVSNPKFFFTRAIGPRIEQPNTVAVIYLDHFRYINTWGYGYGTHINIEYEVMNILSNYPPSVVQLTDNPDRTIDHSTSLAAASNKIVGAAFIRTVYDKDNSAKQNKNVFFARIDARGLPLGTPVNITNNPYFGLSTEANVPFFTGVSIHATPDNRFILVWARLENGKQDIYETIYDATTGVQVSAPASITTATDTISYASPNLAGLDTSAQTFLTYIANQDGEQPVLWGAKLDSAGAILGADFQITAINDIAKVDPGLQITAIKNASKADDFQIAVINGSRFDTVQLSGGNILATWVDDLTKNPTYCVWNTSGNIVKSPTILDSPDGLSTSQIAVTYDQYGHGILTWGNQIYSRMYYALVDGSGTLLTPPMIQRNVAEGSSHIDLGSSTISTAFLTDAIVFPLYLPLVRK